MAKIEFIYAEKDHQPAGVETIEVRPWGWAGKAGQHFYVHNGANFNAATNMWVEIIYTVNGIQIFYTRNFLHLPDDFYDLSGSENSLNQFLQGDFDTYGFGDMFPETNVFLKRIKYAQNNETHSYYTLNISADTGLIFNPDSGPGSRSVDIRFQFIEQETGIQLMRDLSHELSLRHEGKHPDPATFPANSSAWPFARQLNQNAYNLVSQEYREEYFSDPRFVEIFDEWLKNIPASGHILDAGCGHGDPVITKLLEREYHVTGIDLSPEMLTRAREGFPQVEFLEQTVADLTQESVFEGACSLSSMLYLDPIDLFNGIYRLYQALKPGGALLLYAYDLHPGWRGNPFGVELNHWMWSWTYSMQEAVNALEEHGYFKVIVAEDVTSEKEKEEQLQTWQKQRQEMNEDKPVIDIPGFPLPPLPEIPVSPDTVANCYMIIAQRM